MDLAEELLSPVEAAALMGVDPKTVMKWAREGYIPAIELGRGRRQFRRAAIVAALEQFADYRGQQRR